MEIRLQRVNPEIVRHLERRAEELTEKTGVKWTRNDYVKLLIGEDFNKPLEIYKKDRFDIACQNLSETLEQQSKVMNEFIAVQQKILTLLLYGEDE